MTANVDEPSAPDEAVECVEVVPFIARHILREARRGKRPRYDPSADPTWAELVVAYLRAAFTSGFVRIVHRFECPVARARGREVQRCEHGRLVWDCLPCGCACGMDLTREGIRELALLERECREGAP